MDQPASADAELASARVQAQLERILVSRAFATAKSATRFLRFRGGGDSGWPRRSD